MPYFYRSSRQQKLFKWPTSGCSCFFFYPLHLADEILISFALYNFLFKMGKMEILSLLAVKRSLWLSRQSYKSETAGCLRSLCWTERLECIIHYVSPANVLQRSKKYLFHSYSSPGYPFRSRGQICEPPLRDYFWLHFRRCFSFALHGSFDCSINASNHWWGPAMWQVCCISRPLS